MAHSDEFRWFGTLALISEWDILIAKLNSHKYEVTDATSKEFVGFRITCDENFNYYIDQSRMITSIVLEANLAGAADEHLPYPPSGESLSKADISTDLDRHMYNKYFYRRVFRQLMYDMVHTMITIMYAVDARGYSRWWSERDFGIALTSARSLVAMWSMWRYCGNCCSCSQCGHE